MRVLVKIIAICCLGMFVWACNGSKVMNNSSKEEPVVIANDSLEYEIIIIDDGFNGFLNSIAKPPGFHSQGYMEQKNRNYVITWNYRARNPLRFDNLIYQTQIDYDPHIDYGYDVNYKLFNYFQFAQRKYRMSLLEGYSNQVIR